jgi:ribonuclease R
MTNLEQQVLDTLTKPDYKPIKAAGLAKRLKITKKNMPDFRSAMDRLAEKGRVKETKKGLLRPREAPGMVVGIIKRISSGVGFLIPHERPQGDRDGDLFISIRDMHDAHSGDEALVRILKRRGRGGRLCGRVEQILERATNTFVGTYFERAGQSYVQVDGKTFNDPIAVGDPGAKGAKPDDKVVIEILRFPTHFLPGEAVLTKVLGPRGEVGVDTLSIIHEFGLPDEFPDKILEEARLQAEQFDESALGDRLDLTKETIVTIDPADARDFDDAISLTKSKNGHWHLGVHIADVSHFVLPGSALDEEARQRGTSVYLPTRVLPMLPEVISNGLASLQQGKVRYTKSVFIEFTAEGIPVHTQFANSAIKVTKRFAYEDVLPIIQDPERFRTRVSAKVRSLLSLMHKLAMLLRRRRFEAGTLNLDLSEVKLEFDSEGKVSGAHEVLHDESHQIIEEFMLAANIAVATEINDRSIVYLRRVHADPDERKLRAFAEFADVLGFPIKRYQSRPHLQALVEKVRGQPAEHAVNYALLRSMKRAEYAGIELGHYALAVENYCHFTSPIRRYPDLSVHRLIDVLLSSKRKPRVPNELELEKLGKHCSLTERRAADAERELTKVKLLTFMVNRIGDELYAVITGVEKFGMFCQGIEIPVEGLVHISAIESDDYFYYEAATHSLIGRASGRQYRLGDPVRVQVTHVDVDRRELDFRLVNKPKTRKRPKRAEKKQPTRNEKTEKKERRRTVSVSAPRKKKRRT